MGPDKKNRQVSFHTCSDSFQDQSILFYFIFNTCNSHFAYLDFTITMINLHDCKVHIWIQKMQKLVSVAVRQGLMIFFMHDKENIRKKI